MIKKLTLLFIFCITFFVSCGKKELKTNTVNISILREDSLDAEIIELGLKDEIALTNKQVLFTTFMADSSYTSFIEEASKMNAIYSKAVIAIGKKALDAAVTIMPNQNIIFSTIKDDYYFGSSESSNDLYSNARGVYYLPNISGLIEKITYITKSKSLGYVYGKDERSLYMKDIISNVCFEQSIKYIPYYLDDIEDFEETVKYGKKPDMFLITKDKIVMENLYTITKAAYDNFIPVVSTDIFSSENGGILMAVDVNYYRIGRKTAYILNELLDGRKMENIRSIYLLGDETFEILINTDIAEHLNIKFPEELKKNAKIIIENWKIIRSIPKTEN